MPSNDLTHLAERLFNTPLYLTEQKLGVIMQVLHPRLASGSLLLEPSLSRPDLAQQDPDLIRAVDAPATAGNQRLADLAARVVPDAENRAELRLNTVPAGNGQHIAVIRAMGTLVHRSGYLGALSGLTSYEMIRAQLRAALNSSEISGIMFHLGTNGGEGAGLFDLVDEIYQARDDKPIHAYIDERAFSAGAAISTACEVVHLPRTGGTGSIGVIAQHLDQSEWNKKQGLKVTPIYAGARKNDFTPHEPLSKEALSVLQQMVDQGYELFTTTVDRNRSLKPGTARQTEAALYWGEDAVKAGLADSIKTWDQALEALTSKVRSNRQGGYTMAHTTLRQKLAAIFKGHSGDEVAAALEGTATNPQAGDEGPTAPDQGQGSAQVQATAAPAGTTAAPAGTPATAATDQPAGQTAAPAETAGQTPDNNAGQATPGPATTAQQIVTLCNEAGHPDLVGAVITHAGLDADKAKAALATANQINELCEVAGHPQLKGQVVSSSNFNLEQARAAIAAHKATHGDAEPIKSGTTAGPGAEVNYLVKDAEARAARQ